MPRFTLKDLLLAVTLIAVGAAGLGAIFRIDWRWASAGSIYALYFGSWAIIGTGIGALFRRKLVFGILAVPLGGLLGFLILLALMSRGDLP